jgi:CcmD family protein
MTPVETVALLPGLLPDLVRGLAATLTGFAPALPAFAAGAIQVAAEGAAASAGMAAQAAARPETVLRGLRFLSGAYTVVWVLLAAYLVMLSLRQHRLSRQVRRLRERLGA